MWIMKFDLNLDPMTLVLKLDLDIIKMYGCTKNEDTDTQIDRLDWNYYIPHARMV